jgi:prepilin-type N-terminal cleavage/methylation domain-containing protein
MTVVKNRIKARRGFTLAEALMVVAIVVILLALLIPNLVKLRRDLRQKELDAKAELLYIAVQNELIKLRSEATRVNTRRIQHSAAQSLDDDPSERHRELVYLVLLCRPTRRRTSSSSRRCCRMRRAVR